MRTRSSVVALFEGAPTRSNACIATGGVLFNAPSSAAQWTNFTQEVQGRLGVIQPFTLRCVDSGTVSNFDELTNSGQSVFFVTPEKHRVGQTRHSSSNFRLLHCLLQPLLQRQ